MWIDQLYRHVRTFLSGHSERIDILCPFIQVKALDAILLDAHWRSLSVVTTWNPDDMVRGVSDHRVYPYLRDRGASLLIHPRLHAKVFARNLTDLVVSTANISDAGLGAGAASNIECAVRVPRVRRAAIAWLRGVLREARPVTDGVYAEILGAVGIVKRQAIVPGEPIWTRHETLVGSLPRSKSPASLLAAIAQSGGLPERVDPDCAHDLALFDVSPAQWHDITKADLARQFFRIALVRKFMRSFGRGGCYFGEAKRWLRTVCSDAGLSDREDLTRATQVLFNWSAELSHGHLKLARPHYSQLLFGNTGFMALIGSDY